MQQTVTVSGSTNFETGIYRPPSEGGSYSLLFRLTRNCPWNQCAFCSMYKREKFSIRSMEELKSDVDTIAALCMDLEATSEKMGFNGKINHKVVSALIEKTPELQYSQGFSMILDWISSGAKTAFLQDANSLVMKTEDLLEILKYLRSTFPTLNRVTTYCRSKTLVKKSLEDLIAINQAGLDRLHVGLESGYADLLEKIKKGATPDDHIKGGQKALKAGFQLSEYWMPGLGGKEMWESHAIETARVLNAINPHYIRSRPFFPAPGTPLYEACNAGEFQVLSPLEQLRELEMMMNHLEVTGKVCFDHSWNYWPGKNRQVLFSHSYEGYQFPEKKQRVLALLAEGISVQEASPSDVPAWIR